MKRNEVFSKRKGSVISFIWTFFILTVTLYLKDTYNLNFMMYSFITMPILFIGNLFIIKLTKVDK